MMIFPRRARFKRYEPCPACRIKGKDTRGDNLAVYDDDSSYCFSCGYVTHSPASTWKSPKEVDHGPKSVLPSDFTTEVPANAWKWLIQYGLPWSYWSPMCGYSPKEQRLVFKIGTPTKFSIGRKVLHSDGTGSGLAGVQQGDVVRQENGGVPVHGTTSSERKWRIWGDKTRYVEVVGDPEKATSVCLVEDLISAHKIGQVSLAIPLFGTMVYPLVIRKLRELKKPVTIWLDKDQEGNVKAKATLVQQLTNLPVNISVTPNDPKSYSKDVIKYLLNNKEQV